MKVTIDEEKCIGCGACVSQDEEHFEMDDASGKAVVKKSVKYGKCCQEAADICPVTAITITK